MEQMEQFVSETRLFKALMHPVRLAILETLRAGEACVCHLEAALGQRQAYISQQLAVLREAGLVQDRRERWNVYYRVSDTAVFTVLDAADQLTGRSGGAAQPRPPLTGCPCPRCRTESDPATPPEP